jgi:hypothetical protein
MVYVVVYKNLTIIRTSHSTHSVKMLKGCEIIFDKLLGSEVLTVNPFKSNFSANRILPNSYMFWAVNIDSDVS